MDHSVVTIHDVSWEELERRLAHKGDDSLPRIAYDRSNPYASRCAARGEALIESRHTAGSR
jgi:hypothetical protein